MISPFQSLLGRKTGRRTFLVHVLETRSPFLAVKLLRDYAISNSSYSLHVKTLWQLQLELAHSLAKNPSSHPADNTWRLYLP